MKRIYEVLYRDHFSDNRQMAFISGPRQVGKTTCVRDRLNADYYLNWDNMNDRRKILAGEEEVSRHCQLDVLSDSKPLISFDELHKYSKWKCFIKGFFDVYNDKCDVIVTGSARLNIYKKGGDSLMGRYFLYRMHPLTVGELNFNGSDSVMDHEIVFPAKPDKNTIDLLLRFGGYPEPLLKQNVRFYNKWRKLRTELLFHEDIRDLTAIQEMGQLEVMAELIGLQAGNQVNYTNMANELNASVDTIRRWFDVLESIYFSYRITPYYTNIANSLRKQPKVYLWDWSIVKDEGAKKENLIASHLLKAVHWWSDSGLGDYRLHYLRDKAKREVDFLVVKNEKPWFIVEVKSSSQKEISKHLSYYQKQTGAEHAFQVVFDLPYVERDCFDESEPIKVPASTFLAQLV